MIKKYNIFRETMAYFTDLGMSFAVDDVGAGYSGLESIARLKPHFLKIDTSLVRDVHASVVNREMVKAIISLGKGIGATVIAEGIQVEEETKALMAMGIDYGQGFYPARPGPGPGGDSSSPPAPRPSSSPPPSSTAPTRRCAPGSGRTRCTTSPRCASWPGPSFRPATTWSLSLGCRRGTMGLIW